MNIYYLIAAFVAVLSQIGHLTIGRKKFIDPVLKSDYISQEVKGVVHTLFHYMTYMIGVSAVVLFYISQYSTVLSVDSSVIGLFLGCVWAGMGLVALTLSFRYGLFKIFQWIFWFVIAILLFIGTN
ncbi:MAG: hypothetical protein ACRC6R_06300 [Bacteroidales bacterium]